MTSDDLQLLREFRAELPAPDERTRRQIYAYAVSRPETRTRGRRWRIPSVALTAGAAAALIAVLLVSPWSESDGLVQRALAAVGTGPVMHFVAEIPPSTVDVNLKTGRETVRTDREEVWVDLQNGRSQILFSEGNRLESDYVGTSHYRPGSEAAAANNFYVALATGYREALKSGAAKLVGRDTFGGHEIDWLSGGVPGEVGIDAHTYKPVLQRYRRGKRYLYTRILLAKAVAYSPADFKRRGPKDRAVDTRRFAFGYAFGSTNPSAAPGTLVHSPWLTAGPTVAGLELRAVTPFTIRKSKHHFSYGASKPKPIHGLELVYGPPSQRSAPTAPTRINLYGPQWEPRATTRLTTIYEVPAGNTPPWAVVPADSIQLQTGLTTTGEHVTPTLRFGYLRKRGLYITIRTPQGQNTALRIARALHTDPK
jgi:hypothetical protein